MSRIMEVLKKHRSHLLKLDERKNKWIVATELVVLVVFVTIFGWEVIKSSMLLTWTTVAVSTVTTVNWWVWTILTFKEFLVMRSLELHLINEISLLILEIKKDVIYIDNNKK